MSATEAGIAKEAKGLSLFEKYLSVWVILCIVAGIILGRLVPGAAQFLDGLAIYDDRRIKLLRGSHRHLHHALRPLVGSIPGHGGGGPH